MYGTRTGVSPARTAGTPGKKARRGFMDFLTVAMAVYATSALAALCMTHQERKRSGVSAAPGDIVTGYLLCLVWPAVAAVMVVFYRRDLLSVSEPARWD